MSEFKANYLLTPKEVIVDLINKSQRRPTTFTVADLTFEVPQAFDGMKNTSLVIAPTPASGMGWAPRPIFYDRVDLTDFIPELLEFPDATQGITLRDVLDYVETIKPQVKLVTEDFLEREITVPGSFTLRAKPEALLWKGQVNVTVGDVTEEEEEEEERPEIDPNPNPNHPTLTMYAGAGSYREGAEAVVYGSITFDEGRPVPAGQVVISHSGYTENPVVSADLPNGFTLDTTDPASTKIKGFTADTTTGLRNFTLRLSSTAVLGTGDTLANSQTTLTNQIAYDAVNNIHDTAGTTVSYKLLANATPGVELVTQKSVFKPGESFDVKVFINVTENCGNSDDRTYLLKFGPAINYAAFNAGSEFLNASEGSEGVEVSLSGGAIKGTYEGTVTLTVSEDLDESLIGITDYGISIEGVHPELDPRSIAIGFEAAGEEEPPVDPEPEVPGDGEGEEDTTEVVPNWIMGTSNITSETNQPTFGNSFQLDIAATVQSDVPYALASTFTLDLETYANRQGGTVPFEVINFTHADFEAITAVGSDTNFEYVAPAGSYNSSNTYIAQMRLKLKESFDMTPYSDGEGGFVYELYASQNGNAGEPLVISVWMSDGNEGSQEPVHISAIVAADNPSAEHARNDGINFVTEDLQNGGMTGIDGTTVWTIREWGLFYREDDSNITMRDTVGEYEVVFNDEGNGLTILMTDDGGNGLRYFLWNEIDDIGEVENWSGENCIMIGVESIKGYYYLKGSLQV